MTNPPIKDPRKYKKGMRSIPASQLNELADGVKLLKGGVPGPRQKPLTPRPLGITLKRLVVISTGTDWLVCTTPAGYDLGEPYEPEIKVARPWLLRRTPFHGQTRDGVSYSYSSDTERTATKSGDDVDQIIVPKYVLGDEILAVKMPTGIVIAGEPPEPVNYWDINEGGRAWADVEEE